MYGGLGNARQSRDKFLVTRPSPGTGWINDTNAPTKKPRERVHMAVPMFVHGGDSAVGGEKKKKRKKKRRREEEERRGEIDENDPRLRVCR